MAKKQDKPIINYDSGMVLYSDGGCRNKFSGYGIHGYVYSLEPTTKGSGNPTNVPTAKGYLSKADIKEKNLEPKEVKLISYIDAFGSVTGESTNNAAEVIGISNAFKIAYNHDIKSLNVYSDSKYAIGGANGWISKWKTNGWLKEDGTPVANKPDWEQLENNLNLLKQKDIKVNVEWIKGHKGHLGNELADKNARIGTVHSEAKINRAEVTTTPAQGYWSVKSDKHPLLATKKMYFSTKLGTSVAGEYYLGDHGKDDDLIGKKNADGSIAYVELKTPDPILEMVREKQSQIASGRELIVSTSLIKLFSQNVVSDVFRHGDICLIKANPNRFDLSYVGEYSSNKDDEKGNEKGNDGAIVSRVIMPPQLAYRAIRDVNNLKGVLLAYRENEPSIIVTDITDSLYGLDAKSQVEFKNEFIVGIEKFKSEVWYGSTTNKNKYNLDLFFGVDLPNRNAMKRLEKLSPNVKLLTWMESPQAFRYAIVITVQDGSSIWSSVCSNLKILKK